MAYTVYDGIACECPQCGTKCDYVEAHMIILWSNQYGSAIRVFCRHCDTITDRRRTDKNGFSDRVVSKYKPRFDGRKIAVLD